MKYNLISYFNSLKVTGLFSLLKKGRLTGFLLLLLFSFAEARPYNAKGNPIELLPQKLTFTPKEFYIANIIDEREDPSAIAWLLTAKSPAAKAAGPEKVDLKGGGKAAIQAFIHKSLKANPTLRPVTIRLKDCRITETAGKNGGVDGKISLQMDFGYLRNGESLYLTSYKGGIRYTRAAGSISLVEPALRQSLASALKYFNSWMEREAGTNIKLAKGVKIFIRDAADKRENDTVFYAADRPLRWDDFQAQPRPGSPYAASVSPSFSYEGSSEMKEGYVHLTLAMKVYVLKKSSWVKSSARDSYSLEHEQRHFDIVKLVVEKFKERLNNATFDPHDFDRVIAAYYVDAYREMNRLQDQYDSETRHGLDQSAQKRWNIQLEEMKLGNL